MTKHAAGV